MARGYGRRVRVPRRGGGRRRRCCHTGGIRRLRRLGGRIVGRDRKDGRVDRDVVDGALRRAHRRLEARLQTPLVEHVTARAELRIDVGLVADGARGGARHFHVAVSLVRVHARIGR